MNAKNDARKAGKGWTDGEVRAVVKAYNEMLAKELAGEKYKKVEYRRRLMNGYLKNRSNGSIEMKLMNISAVRAELGLPIIAGYKPYGNAQSKLADIIVSEES